MRRRWLVGLAAGCALLVVAVGLWAFEPWRAFTSSEVDEVLPSAAPSVGAATPPAQPSSGARSEEPSTAEPRPKVVELAAGDLETAEHATTGRVRVVELADGRRFVRFEDLATSDGPDLHVWVTDQPSGGSWGSYDDGRSVPLGELTATRGNQNYEIPGRRRPGGPALGRDLACFDRFDVAFARSSPTPVEDQARASRLVAHASSPHDLAWHGAGPSRDSSYRDVEPRRLCLESGCTLLRVAGVRAYGRQVDRRPDCRQSTSIAIDRSEAPGPRREALGAHRAVRSGPA